MIVCAVNGPQADRADREVSERDDGVEWLGGEPAG
jgi:hypothetical protein